MKRYSRRLIYAIIRDKLEDAALEPDDDTLAKVYEVLTLDDCEPNGGEFVVGD